MISRLRSVGFSWTVAVSGLLLWRAVEPSNAQAQDFVPSELAIHMILDNYGTHNHPKVKAWLEKHPRFHFHFTPTSSSWLNLVERWFGEITRKRIRRGGFPRVVS